MNFISKIIEICKNKFYHIVMIDIDDIKIILGANVKELRLKKGLTQEQLGERIKLDAHTISMIETGKTFISGEVLANLCNIFEVEPSVFFMKSITKSQEDLNYISEIKRMLPAFSSSKLREIYNIINALRK